MTRRKKHCTSLTSEPKLLLGPESRIDVRTSVLRLRLLIYHMHLMQLLPSTRSPGVVYAKTAYQDFKTGSPAYLPHCSAAKDLKTLSDLKVLNQCRRHSFAVQVSRTCYYQKGPPLLAGLDSKWHVVSLWRTVAAAAIWSQRCRHLFTLCGYMHSWKVLFSKPRGVVPGGAQHYC